MSPLPILIIVFALVMALVLLVAQMVNNRSTRMRRRLEQLAPSGAPSQKASVEPSAQKDQLPGVSRFLSSRGLTEMLMLEMARAGLKWRPSEFAVLIAGCVVLFLLLGVMLRFSPMLIPIIGLMGYALPIGFLKFRQQQRLRAFNGQIADALSLMASSLRSGYSFMRALQVVSNEMPAPISEEFERVIQECNLGVSTDEALIHLSERMRSYDMDLVVTAVNIQMQLGGNLAEVLDTIAETIRERVRINGEISALTADGKLSGIILIALPIFLGVVIRMLNPSYMSPLLAERFGQLLLVAAACWMIVGAFAIYKMLQVDI